MQPPLDRVKQIEPHVIDNTPSLVVQILAMDRFIPGQMVQEIKEDLKKVMKVLDVHRKSLEPYPQIVVAGYKVVEGADGYAEAVLLMEFRYSQDDFRKVPFEKLDDKDYNMKDDATKYIFP